MDSIFISIKCTVRAQKRWQTMASGTILVFVFKWRMRQRVGHPKIDARSAHDSWNLHWCDDVASPSSIHRHSSWLFLSSFSFIFLPRKKWNRMRIMSKRLFYIFFLVIFSCCRICVWMFYQRVRLRVCGRERERQSEKCLTFGRRHRTLYSERRLNVQTPSWHSIRKLQIFLIQFVFLLLYFSQAFVGAV